MKEKITKPSRPIWAIAIASIILLVLGSWLTFAKPKFAFVDFGDYYYAGRLIKLGKDPYNGKEADKLAKHEGFDYIEGSHYIYPPVLAYIVSLTSGLKARAAAAIWFLLSAFLLLVSIVIMVRFAYPRLSSGGAGGIIILAIFYAPGIYTLYVGQVNAIILASIVFALDAMRRKEENLTGYCLGFAAVIKFSPVALFAPLALRLKKRILVMAIGIPAIMLILCELVMPGVTTKFFLDVMPSLWEFRPHHAHPVNQSIRGVVLRMFQENNWTTPYIALSPDTIGTIIKLLVLGLGAGTCVVLWRSWRRETAQNEESKRWLEWGLVIIAFTIGSPLGWESSFLLLLVPYAALLRVGYWKWVVPSYLLMFVQRFGFEGFANKPHDFPTLAQHPAIISLGLISGLICMVGCVVALQKKIARTAE